MKQAIEFQNSLHYRLAGWWEAPSGGGTWPAVIFAHDAGSDKDDQDAAAVVELLQARGISALRFDFTGRGESQGEPAESTFVQQTDDLLWAMEYAIRRPDCTGSVAIHGSGAGCRAALQVAIESAILAGLVLHRPEADAFHRFAGIITAPTLIIEVNPVPAPSQKLFDALECPCKQIVLPTANRERAALEAADWLAEQFTEVRAVIAFQS